MADEKLVLVAVPTLVALLLHHENAKGAPLTEEEVIAIRDGAVCIAMPVHVAHEVAQKRGYNDIRLENAWEDWTEIRPSLNV